MPAYRFERITATRVGPQRGAAMLVLSRKKDGQCVYYGLRDELTLKLCALVREWMAD